MAEVMTPERLDEIRTQIAERDRLLHQLDGCDPRLVENAMHSVTLASNRLATAVPELLAHIDALTDRLRWRKVQDEAPELGATVLVKFDQDHWPDTFAMMGNYWHDGAEFVVAIEPGHLWRPL